MTEIAERVSKVETWQHFASGRQNDLCERVDKIEQLIDGHNGHLGLRAKVLIVWHSYCWLWGVLGAALGFALKSFLP